MNDMKRLMVILVMVAVGVLPTMAQNFEVQQPNATFQSTSAMTGSGSAYSSNPTLNDNGTAEAPVTSAPRSLRKGTLPPPPSVDENDSGNVPLGEPWVLAIFAAAFAAVIAVRRRRTLNRKDVKPLNG